MTEYQLITELFSLKPSLKSEAYDFVAKLISKQKKEIDEKKPQFGCARGQFIMSDDFDAPFFKGDKILSTLKTKI